MRRAVKKPAVKHQKSIKAQSHPNTRSLQTVLVKPSVKRLDQTRLQHAQKINKSQLVSRFSSDLFSGQSSTSVIDMTTIPQLKTAGTPEAPRRGKPKTTAELLEYALKQATTHEQELPKPARRGLFKRRARSATA
jgi:hypothetical protein